MLVVSSNNAQCAFTSSILFIAQGQSIIPMLTGEVIPVMELLSSMKSHSVPEEIDVSPCVLCILNTKGTLALWFGAFFGRQNPTVVINSCTLQLFHVKVSQVVSGMI